MNRANHAIVQPTLIALGILALILAMWGGIVRMGWGFPSLIRGLPGIHGPLVVCGFLGTILSLERAMAVRNRWAYLIPGLMSGGSFVMMIDPTGDLPRYIIMMGSIGFTFLCFLSLYSQKNLFSLMIFGGSGLWLTGIIIWAAGWPVFNIYLWWTGAVLFTMVGQRLELTQRSGLTQRLLPILVTGLCLVFVGQVFTALGHIKKPDYVMDIYRDAIKDPRLSLGMKISGAGMLLTALWHLRYDSSWTLRSQGGISGYMAFCLLSSYGWLAVSGACSFLFSGLVSGFSYSAITHAFFVGFVFFILFGHTPALIFSFFGYRPRKMGILFISAFTMHIGLLLWIGGDMSRNEILAKSGGMLSGFVISAFLLGMTWAVVHDKFYQTRTKQTGEPG